MLGSGDITSSINKGFELAVGYFSFINIKACYPGDLNRPFVRVITIIAKFKITATNINRLIELTLRQTRQG